MFCVEASTTISVPNNWKMKNQTFFFFFEDLYTHWFSEIGLQGKKKRKIWD